MPSKKPKSKHSGDPADFESPRPPKNRPSLPKSPNPSSNPNPNPPKSSKKEPNPSTGSMANESNPSSQRKRKGRDSNDEDDALTILSAVADFRSKTGATPTPGSIKPFYDSLRGSLHSEITQEQLYNKLRHLRRKFRKIAESVARPSDDDRAFYDISLKAWEATDGKKKKKTEANGERLEENGEEEDQEMEMSEGEDAADDDSLKYLVHEIRGFWKTMGLPESDLDFGLKRLDRAKAKALQKKWRDCLEVEMKLRVKRHDLNKELCAGLVTSHRSL